MFLFFPLVMIGVLFRFSGDFGAFAFAWFFPVMFRWRLKEQTFKILEQLMVVKKPVRVRSPLKPTIGLNWIQ